MPATLLSRSTYRERASLRSRLAALAMALGGAVLVLIALIELGILPTPTPRDLNTLRTFDVVPVASPARTVSASLVAPSRTCGCWAKLPTVKKPSRSTSICNRTWC